MQQKLENLPKVFFRGGVGVERPFRGLSLGILIFLQSIQHLIVFRNWGFFKEDESLESKQMHLLNARLQQLWLSTPKWRAGIFHVFVGFIKPIRESHNQTSGSFHLSFADELPPRVGFGFFFKIAQYFADSYKNIDLLSQIVEPPVFKTKLSIFLLIRKKYI